MAGFLRKIFLLGRAVSRLQLPLYGANASFFLMLSLFPCLLLILSGLRYSTLSATDLIELLQGIVPGALMGSAERLIVSTYYNTSGAVLSVSAIAALWSASRGILGLMKGLNRAYGVKENRNWLHTRLLSIVYLFAFLVVLTVTLVAHVFGSSIITALEQWDFPFAAFVSQVIDLRLVLLIGLQIGIFALMYAALPNRDSRFRENFPGAVIAAVGWQGFSQLFSVYVTHFSDYANIFGSVYAMALGMLWLYCCVVIVLFGGAVNRFLSKGQGM